MKGAWGERNLMLSKGRKRHLVTTWSLLNNQQPCRITSFTDYPVDSLSCGFFCRTVEYVDFMIRLPHNHLQLQIVDLVANVQGFS